VPLMGIPIPAVPEAAMLRELWAVVFLVLVLVVSGWHVWHSAKELFREIKKATASVESSGPEGKK
jgi:hypothetical protein